MKGTNGHTRQRIHKDYEIYFRTIGDTMQTRVTILSPERYTSDDPIQMVEPGRTILIGDIDQELERLFTAWGKPTLNEFTATDDRPAGIFSTRSFKALREYLFSDREKAPRARSN